MPETNAAMTITVIVPITTPSTVRNERSLCCHRVSSPMRTFSRRLLLKRLILFGLEVLSATSAYLCDLCVNCNREKSLTQRSQRYAEIAAKTQIVVRITFRAKPVLKFSSDKEGVTVKRVFVMMLLA